MDGFERAQKYLELGMVTLFIVIGTGLFIFLGYLGWLDECRKPPPTKLACFGATDLSDEELRFFGKEVGESVVGGGLVIGGHRLQPRNQRPPPER